MAVADEGWGIIQGVTLLPVMFVTSQGRNGSLLPGIALNALVLSS